MKLSIKQQKTMKTFLWCEVTYKSFSEHFLAVTAESLEEARTLARNEVNRICKEELKHTLLSESQKKYYINERDNRLFTINTTYPEIVEPNVARLFEHGNE